MGDGTNLFILGGRYGKGAVPGSKPAVVSGHWPSSGMPVSDSPPGADCYATSLLTCSSAPRTILSKGVAAAVGGLLTANSWVPGRIVVELDAPETERTIMALEQRLLCPDVRSSRTELDALLADEFAEIGSSGHVWNKSEIIAALGNESGVTFSIDDFRASPLSNELVLAIYRVTRKSDGGERRSVRSSIWRFERGQWQMVFNQGTPVDS